MRTIKSVLFIKGTWMVFHYPTVLNQHELVFVAQEAQFKTDDWVLFCIYTFPYEYLTFTGQ